MDTVSQLALAFGAAVTTGLVARRLGQSVVPAYVLCGMLVGPPVLGLVTDRALFEPLSTLGLVLLLFFMGLESSASALTAAPRRTAKDAALDFALNFTPALAIGLAFGWPLVLAAFLGLASYATSSGIAIKAIIELRRLANMDTGVIMNLMVVEDLVTAILLAAIAGFALDPAHDPLSMAWAGLKAFVLCAAFMLVARPLVRYVSQRTAPRPHMSHSHELFLLGVLAAVLGTAALAEGAGLSAALGAFLLGLALSDSVHGPRLRESVVPLRDASVAMFFFAFGMLVDVAHIGDVLPMLLVLIPVTLATKFVTGLVIASRRGQTAKARFNIATAMLPRGEFSIVVADVAVLAGFGAALSTVAGVYVVVTAVLGSVLMTLTGRLVAATRHRGHLHQPLPRRLRRTAQHRAEAMRATMAVYVPPLRTELERGFTGKQGRYF